MTTTKKFEMIIKVLKQILNFREFFNNIKKVRANNQNFKRQTNGIAVSASTFVVVSILSMLPEYLNSLIVINNLIIFVSLILTPCYQNKSDTIKK